ncbi:Zn-finger containing protein [Clostridium carboxidivorans P7]|uniref:Endodeoxyribonuclease RusA n=1 Tax=Clostridium carboxidivorans P7 TaxID=536227 RepID=C6PVY6_9CLOT|nr:RusA family crossover junction endodeoxyribonuclease [Clostridium carboxidivorans]AKN32767.1 Zn-finger containing protein [Clostridium carboxidivorans P7]EET86617.1 endodeoxyribonuclease RusA [Clostridium carboxidivorans P7]EFG89994.1 crossover junction endodeoxyribonuclease RusA [Clostridium carboxidivorans P7]
MIKTYAKVIVKGSPLSKSNFKLFNVNGRAILPYNSGKYHDRYALYEEEIAYEARCQNPGVVLSEALIAVLKVYYKSKKRHPDTNNITKSIFDGIEKSGLIINDAQVRRLIIEEFYDQINPRFELELFGESTYFMDYKILKREIVEEPIQYSPPPNKSKSPKVHNSEPCTNLSQNDKLHCEICGKKIKKENSISANNGKTIICKDCLTKLF